MEENNKSTVTVSAIADALGVSKGLVSRALTGKTNVSSDMRNAIIKKAIEMGYDFDRLRTKLKRRNVLLVMTSDMMLKEEYWQPIILSIASTLDERNINLEYFIYDEDSLSEEQLQGLVRSDIRGYIFMHNNLERALEEVEKTSYPIVIVDPKRVLMGKTLRVKYSNHDSVYSLVELLVENGHKHICFYGSKTWSVSFAERCQGFDDCIAMHEKEGVTGYHVLFDNLDRQYADNEAFEGFLQKNPQITAVVGANDIIALNAMQSLRRMGRRVPEDVSITGFDNLTRCEYISPALTTVNVPRKEIGEEVAKYLIDHINAPSNVCYSQIIIDCDLMVRDSIKNINN